jgi:hypothetical protein
MRTSKASVRPISVLAAALALACGAPRADSAEPRVGGERGGAAAPARRATLAPLRLRALAREALPAAVEPAGRLVRAFAWRDARGDNLIVFARRETEGAVAIEAAYHVGRDGRFETLARVRDAVEDCDLDASLFFVGAALGMKDRDADGVGELTFAYRIDCRGDLSPRGLRLYVLEHGETYALTGRGRFECAPDVAESGEPGCTGEMRVEREGAPWPAPFLEHARAVWRRVAVEEPGHDPPDGWAEA